MKKLELLGVIGSLALLASFAYWNRVYLYPLLLIAGLLLIAQFVLHRRIVRLRKAGLYPEKGKETTDHVRRLAVSGESALAMRCYRQVNPEASLKETRKYVLGLQIGQSLVD